MEAQILWLRVSDRVTDKETQEGLNGEVLF
jgi:hypothetical protein